MNPNQAEVITSNVQKTMTEKDLGNEMFQEGFRRGTTSENIGVNIFSDAIYTEITTPKELLSVGEMSGSSERPGFTSKPVTDKFIEDIFQATTVGIEYVTCFTWI